MSASCERIFAMTRRHSWRRSGKRHLVALAMLPLAVLPFAGAAGAHRFLPSALFAAKKEAAASAAEHPQLRATVQPAITIPAEPLGFSPPGAYYLGMRYSMVSLDFLDENRLLFTFRVPGLIHRTGKPEDSEGERKVRAVV